MEHFVFIYFVFKFKYFNLNNYLRNAEQINVLLSLFFSRIIDEDESNVCHRHGSDLENKSQTLRSINPK